VAARAFRKNQEAFIGTESRQSRPDGADVSLAAVDRDRMTSPNDEAEDWINDVRSEVAHGADPEEMCYLEFGLEPDYIWELLG
jgi:hypothetical protein